MELQRLSFPFWSFLIYNIYLLFLFSKRTRIYIYRRAGFGPRVDTKQGNGINLSICASFSLSGDNHTYTQAPGTVLLPSDRNAFLVYPRCFQFPAGPLLQITFAHDVKGAWGCRLYINYIYIYICSICCKQTTTRWGQHWVTSRLIFLPTYNFFYDACAHIKHLNLFAHAWKMWTAAKGENKLCVYVGQAV